MKNKIIIGLIFILGISSIFVSLDLKEKNEQKVESIVSSSSDLSSSSSSDLSSSSSLEPVDDFLKSDVVNSLKENNLVGSNGMSAEERRIAETGNDYNANLDGMYIGAYGFYRGTYESEALELGLDPYDYSPATQDEIAQYHADKYYDGNFGFKGLGW